MRKLLFILITCFAFSVEGAERISADEYFGSVFPASQREAYENSSGSCVYMSTACAGIYQNCPIAWTLPWDTIYGDACRGGSYPSLFERVARDRGLKAISVTGDYTYEYMKWAIKNNRFVAIGCSTAHFQTLVGYDEKNDIWYVWDCNRYHYVYKYNFSEFSKLHEASGKWCIILVDYPDRPLPFTREVK